MFWLKARLYSFLICLLMLPIWVSAYLGFWLTAPSQQWIILQATKQDQTWLILAFGPPGSQGYKLGWEVENYSRRKLFSTWLLNPWSYIQYTIPSPSVNPDYDYPPKDKVTILGDFIRLDESMEENSIDGYQFQALIVWTRRSFSYPVNELHSGSCQGWRIRTHTLSSS